MDTPSDTPRPAYAGADLMLKRETRLCGRPNTKLCIDMEDGLCRRPSVVYMGNSREGGGGDAMQCQRRGSRPRSGGILYTNRKPDNAGGPLLELRRHAMAVSVGGLLLTSRGARHSKGAVLRYTARCTEAGLCRRPYCIALGSPTEREAHCEDLRTHVRQYRPEPLELYI